MSIETKTFHCEGGSIYGLLASKNLEKTIRFIVAYQTISDYLDNLCDRSTSLNPDDFRVLHESIIHALTPEPSVATGNETVYKCNFSTSKMQRVYPAEAHGITR